MQYRLKKENLSENLIQNDFNILKDELKQKLEEEKNRQNIDNAKKRAVNQHVEYEQFEQMVLGANLKALKQDEILKLQELHKQNYQKQNIDNLFKLETKQNNILRVENKQDQDALQIINLYQFQDIKKLLNKYKLTSNNKIKSQQLEVIIQDIYENLDQIFSFDFDNEIFMNFVKKLFKDFDNDQQSIYQLFKLLILISSCNNFEILIKQTFTQYHLRFFKRIAKESLKKFNDKNLTKEIDEFNRIYFKNQLIAKN